MGATVGAVIDYLVAGLADPLKEWDSNARVFDTHPGKVGNSWVNIGRSAPDEDEAATTETQYASLGAGRIEESYTVNGIIHAERPGPKAKPARDAALGMLDVVIRYIHADPTLGGLLQRGRIGLVSQYSLQQAGNGSNSAELLAEVTFGLTIHNTYVP